MGYEVPFPIRIIRIAPVNAKFSDDLSHRDFLGALMNLGIERDLLGDIVVRENQAYLFALEHMAPFIMENLDRVKHTSVRCEVLEEVPEDIKPVLEEEDLIVSNIRIDAILSKLYHLARGTAQEMVREGRVLVNGRQIMSTSFEPKDGDVLVLRGYGKARFVGKSGDTIAFLPPRHSPAFLKNLWISAVWGIVQSTLRQRQKPYARENLISKSLVV